MPAGATESDITTDVLTPGTLTTERYPQSKRIDQLNERAGDLRAMSRGAALGAPSRVVPRTGSRRYGPHGRRGVIRCVERGADLHTGDRCDLG